MNENLGVKRETLLGLITLGMYENLGVKRETLLDLITLGKHKNCYIKSQYSFWTVIILHETGNSRDMANFCLRAIVCKNDRCLLDDVMGVAPITQVTHVRNKEKHSREVT